MVVFASFSVPIVIILTLIPVSLSQTTLCDSQKALTIPTNALVNEKWYMQVLAFQSLDIPCAQFCFNTDSDNKIISINGSYTPLGDDVGEVTPVNIPISVSNSNGTIISFFDWPNMKLQFVDYNNGEDVAIAKSIVMLVCNAKFELWALGIATTERNLSKDQVLMVEALADVHNPGLNASLADNRFLNQNNCIND